MATTDYHGHHTSPWPPWITMTTFFVLYPSSVHPLHLSFPPSVSLPPSISPHSSNSLAKNFLYPSLLHSIPRSIAFLNLYSATHGRDHSIPHLRTTPCFTQKKRTAHHAAVSDL